MPRVPFGSRVQQALAHLADAQLLRDPPTVASPQGPVVDLDGRSLICLCSNNYLGLASHPALLTAAREALETWGLGAAASRLISGTTDAHEAAEHRLARFVGTPSALLFSSGYAANVGLLSSLAGPGDLVLSDRLNHASLIDGCRLSRAEVHVYRHRDAGHLEALLRVHRPRARGCFVVTDALFSMDGVRAPLTDLRALCDAHDAALLVDEAHALGVLGPRGRGLSAEVGVRPDVLVGTLGKAFGVAGAFIAADAPVVRLVANRARSYVFSTAPPPLLAAAAARAADLVEAADDARARLRSHGLRLRRGLRHAGFDVPVEDTPIVPVLVGAPAPTMALSRALFDRGVLALGIRPPTVPPGTSRLRLTVMATHEDDHIDQALGAFTDIGPPVVP